MLHGTAIIATSIIYLYYELLNEQSEGCLSPFTCGQVRLFCRAKTSLPTASCPAFLNESIPEHQLILYGVVPT